MIHSWGNFPKIKARKEERWWIDDLVQWPQSGGEKFLPVGMGRSYGDSATLSHERGKLLGVQRYDRLLSYDENTLELQVEAGCSVEKVLEWSLPRGLFLPVVPGTRHVTMGGALANDIHGKNHHKAGTFGCSVKEFSLLRSGESELKSYFPQDQLFGATVGGLGLTGVVTKMTICLEKIEGNGIVKEETRRFESISEACRLLDEMDSIYPMTVAWIDMGSSRSGSGVAMGGKFVAGEGERLQGPKIGVPCFAPEFALNRLSIGLFNRAYSFSKSEGTRKVSCANYFFPLDGVAHWNRLYGARGFLQYQCVVPLEAPDILEQIRLKICDSDERAFLSVLKKFGSLESPGWLSFPQPGWTLAMDFPMRGDSTLKLMRKLDELVAECGGRLYPAKDARMDADFFQKSFPRWKELEDLRDPQIMSEFWRRVTR